MFYKYIAPANSDRCYVYSINWVKTYALNQEGCSVLSQYSIINTSSQ